jgi:hypothetical protein
MGRLNFIPKNLYLPELGPPELPPPPPGIQIFIIFGKKTLLTVKIVFIYIFVITM